ncbi:MAG: hypothetical protein CSA62_04195 [Planctomycetota bacterium]|nr:MAG: hypothetical protein CSA62_04195 [Planctomycetota bacterium]
MTLITPLDTSPVTRPSIPSTLHVGSGKNWRPEYLNLDIEPRWRPDILYDLAQPLPADGQVTVDTERFGRLTLSENLFPEIIAQDVLEHIPDLSAAMTTMLHWLRVGGVLRIFVPYELSLGAWSDPTHVRAFNERSFHYYTVWSWYLGWRTHHFALTKMEFVPTDFGKSLTEKGVELDELLRTPRAIEQMYVELTKQALSPEDLRVTETFLDGRR